MERIRLNSIDQVKKKAKLMVEKNKRQNSAVDYLLLELDREALGKLMRSGTSTHCENNLLCDNTASPSKRSPSKRIPVKQSIPV